MGTRIPNRYPLLGVLPNTAASANIQPKIINAIGSQVVAADSITASFGDCGL